MKNLKGVALLTISVVCLLMYANAVKIEKDLMYNNHTLNDAYTYGKTERKFQWDKISALLDTLEKIQKENMAWGILQNYKNKHGKGPVARNAVKDAYKGMSDAYGVEQTQSVPLYFPNDLSIPERYGRDGSLVHILKDSADYIKVRMASCCGEWMVPRKYVKAIDTVSFRKTVFVDRTNQNICTMENKDTAWIVRSMNPATTGLHHPPLQRATPLGIFVIQEKKPKMFYLHDGTSELAGFAPWASRFCNGGYIHGVPLNSLQGTPAEFSSTLGSTPRSHMCVRNATSHAKFMYDWAPTEGTLVFVFD